MTERMVLEHIDGAVATLTLNRPKALNALCRQLISELGDHARKLEADPDIRVIVLTGSPRIFAAGADVTELSESGPVEAAQRDDVSRWETIARLTKPVIAAVQGHALGGGFELALMCDIIVASDNARFGFPEVNLGVMPGAGGTQRLAFHVGKSVLMRLCLTGEAIGAQEAARLQIISDIFPADTFREHVAKLAQTIASKPACAARAIKKTVNHRFEVGLSAGIEFERQQFYSLYATADRDEGMRAFREKREPHFTHR